MNLLPVPRVEQETEWTCGAACVQAVLSFFGTTRSEPDLAARMDTSPQEGARPEALAGVFRREGLEAVAVPMRPEQVRACLRKGLPVILLLQGWGEAGADYAGENVSHYVVAVGFDAGMFFFRDPYAAEKLVALDEGSLGVRWYAEAGGRAYSCMGIVARRS